MSDTTLFAAPTHLRRLQIEITTGCNLRCAGCQRTIGMDAHTWRNAHMPPARLSAILANAPPADAVILQGIGEPTLHPALPEMIAAARASGKFGVVSFNTNALAREPSYYRHLREVGLGHVSISVDSLRPETSAAVRAGTDCARLAEAVATLIRLFQGSVTLSVVISRRNLGELGALLRDLHALGGRTVEVQPLVSYGPDTEAMALRPEDMRAAMAVIAATRSALPGLTVLPAPALTPDGSRCRRPFRAAYVTVDGFLTPCCLTNDPSLFGRVNLAEMSFAQAWQTAGVRGFLGRYFDAEPEICHGCAFNPSTRSPAPDTAVPDTAVAHARLRGGDVAGAEAGFRQALAGSAEALHGLGLARFQAGDATGAEPLLRASRDLAPDPRVTHNLAMALERMGRHPEAIVLERENLAGNPGYVPSYHGLSGALQASGHASDAAGVELALIERALDAGNDAVANAAVARAVALDPLHPGLVRVANRLRIAGRGAAAITLLDARLSRSPDDAGARLSRAMARLAVVHDDVAEIAERRAAYAADLAELDARLGAETGPVPGGEQVGTAKPFYLSYQGQDDTALQRVYGRIVTRMMGPSPPFVPPVLDGRIRVGFATAYFHLHSVSKLFGGWIRHLDRRRFDVIGYHLGDGEDAMSADLAAHCTRFHRKAGDDAAWMARIAADAPHVLIYPEIGMHPLAVRLACRRLAPVQCVAWGHPVTTGLPTIDHFLSSELMEPADGARHYTENLVRLPNLSIQYQPPPADTGTMTRADFGVTADDIAYLCCQSLFKYHPADDAVLVSIAARVAAARFVFIGDRARDANARMLHDRLARGFAAAGLDPSHRLLFVPPVPADEFPALLRASDIYLDSLRWSGGNTTLEAIACGLPVVTCPGAMMRGRHSAAILTRAGAGRWIAESEEGYVAFAAALADPAERAGARALLRAGRDRLFDDPAPVRALEDFLHHATAAACSARPAAA